MGRTNLYRYAVAMDDGVTVIGKSNLTLYEICDRLILGETLTLDKKDESDSRTKSEDNYAERMRDLYGQGFANSRIEGSVYINMQHVLRIQEIE